MKWIIIIIYFIKFFYSIFTLLLQYKKNNEILRKSVAWIKIRAKVNWLTKECE